jgi:hypothetical protein
VRLSDLLYEAPAPRFDRGMRPQKITFGNMREMGVRSPRLRHKHYGCSAAFSASIWLVKSLILSSISGSVIARASRL